MMSDEVATCSLFCPSVECLLPAHSVVMGRVMFSNLHSENSAAIALFMLFTLWIYSALRLLSDAARLNEGKK